MTTAAEPVVWSRRLLRAAYWVVRVLGPTGRDSREARAAWISLPVAGEVDLAELRSAEVGLGDVGLLESVGDLLVPEPRIAALCGSPGPVPLELLLGAIVEASPPLWLLTATTDGERLAMELVPDEVEEAIAGVIPDPARREAFLLTRARTVDAKERSAIGAAGEAAVAEACRDELSALGHEERAAEVRLVSEISDELGFDVAAPRCNGTLRRLEVKTTRSAAPVVTVFVTRNEFETGVVDPDWHLVVVRSFRKGGHSILGHLAAEKLEGLMPRDSGDAGRWQVARVRLSLAGLSEGLPPAA
jgi:hypothetical protein